MNHRFLRYTAALLISTAMVVLAHGQEAEEANPIASRASGLIPQSGQGDDIRAAFNRNRDNVRLMVLLSPT